MNALAEISDLVKDPLRFPMPLDAIAEHLPIIGSEDESPERLPNLMPDTALDNLFADDVSLPKLLVPLLAVEVMFLPRLTIAVLAFPVLVVSPPTLVLIPVNAADKPERPDIEPTLVSSLSNAPISSFIDFVALPTSALIFICNSSITSAKGFTLLSSLFFQLRIYL
jgi:hypothetical protein